jgi:putative transposase
MHVLQASACRNKISNQAKHSNMSIIVKNTRNLPHIMPVGASFFVTWRLFGSIPKNKAELFKAQRAFSLNELEHQKLSPEEYNLAVLKIQNAYYQRFEDALDNDTYSEHHLKRPEFAQLIIDRLKEYDEKYYHLEAYCIMSNHVHALFDFSVQLPEKMLDFKEEDYVQLSKVMQLIKGGTAYKANKILGKRGSFWEDESFDTFIRSERHRQTVKEYIINNPVKANICKHWKDYPYTFCNTCTTDFGL